MKLLPTALRNRIPLLYATEDEPDPTVWAKFVCRISGWEWYVIEFDGADICFGWVKGFEPELGYFSLAEIASIHELGGTSVVLRDPHFAPCPLSQVKQHA